jgi:serpin B
VGSHGKNLVLSPTSVMIALSMARPGAEVQTAAQMDKVMHDAATDANATWMNALDRALGTRTATFKDEEGTARKVTLRVVNAAFLQRDYPFEQRYLDALAQRFGAGIRLTDFRADPAASRNTINAWVKDKTGGRIPSLLAAKDVTPRTRFALVNAIYLKAAWARAFSPDDTVSAPFRLASGTRVRVPTMVGPKEMGWVRYATGSGWQAAELPYIGGELAMTVILPDSLTAFEKSMTRKRLDAIVGKVARAPLMQPNPKYPQDAGVAWKIALPKFSFQSRADLKSALAAAGMPDAFDALRADFTGIADPSKSGEGPLYISRAIHQANISVDEKGTTAAASTAILGETGGGPETRYFKVNRPFLFVLRDVPTGAILFMGRVVDPRAH